jgi:hypothetical protein
MVGGVGACHLVGHRRGGSGRSRAETTGEALGVPLPEPQHRGRRLLWRRQVNKGPTCCTRKSYWGATKKAFDFDQYGAPPINRSKEDDQSGCTRNPHWGAAKKACGVDMYGAPPMDRSKDGQAGVPAAVPAGRQR